MKTRTLICVVVALGLLIVLLGATYVWASPTLPRLASVSVPSMMNYQGVLSDPAMGDPVPDGDYEITFALYDVASGGTALWTETQTVTVENGLFSVLLGSVNPLSTDAFTGSTYLGVKVGADAEMTPRHRIVSVAYAIHAREATNADTVDGAHASAFAQATHDHWGEAWSGSTDTGSAGLTLTNSGSGTGIRSSSDSGYGGYFTTTTGIAVYGWGFNPVEPAILGENHYYPGVGVEGRADEGTGVKGVGSCGVYGDGNTGVCGHSEAHFAVAGYSSSGVAGYFDSTTGKAIEADGDVEISGDLAVYAEGSEHHSGYLTTTTGIAVYGRAFDPDAPAILGENHYYPGVGVEGRADVGTGVSGEGDTGVAGSGHIGVFGYSEGLSGTAGWFRNTTGKAIRADGNVQINGDLTVIGQISGFPRPDFDSDWMDVPAGGSVTITHNLQGDAKDYVVDMTFRDQYYGSGIHQNTYGGDVRPGPENKGMYWEDLTSTSIKVVRMSDDVRCQQVRIRIWMYR